MIHQQNKIRFSRHLLQPKWHTNLIVVYLLTAIFFAGCSEIKLSGSISETTNGTVSGIVVYTNGTPASGVSVSLYPQNYNPLKDPLPSNFQSVKTNDRGSYVISHADSGVYNLYAIDSIGTSKALVSLDVKYDTVTQKNAVLALTGAIRVMVTNDIDSVNGYVYIPGTDIKALFGQNTGSKSVVLSGVPQGVALSVYYGIVMNSKTQTIANAVSVMSNDTTVIANPFWLYKKNLILNTAVQGADVANTIPNFPVLVRLTSANFEFSQAQHDGSDLRFTNSNNTLLSYEIERFDAANQQAEIWVKVDTIFGNNSSQFIQMYWGTQVGSVSPSLSNANAVFDTVNGFVGVWHLGEAQDSTAKDATGNHYDGTPFGMSATSTASGAIGIARQFNGTSSYITMQNTATSKLNFSQNSNYSLSMWACVDTIDTTWQMIAGKGHEQYFAKIKCYGNNRATWEFVEYQDAKGWEFTQDSVPPAPGSKAWVYLTGVRSGTNQLLYVNGELVNATATLRAGVYARNTSDDFMIGRHAREVFIPGYEGWGYFHGKVEEVRAINLASKPDWIKLCYMNQRADDKLVVFR